MRTWVDTLVRREGLVEQFSINMHILYRALHNISVVPVRPASTSPIKPEKGAGLSFVSLKPGILRSVVIAAETPLWRFRVLADLQSAPPTECSHRNQHGRLRSNAGRGRDWGYRR